MRSSTIIWTVIIALVVLGGAFYFWSSNNVSTTNTTVTTTPSGQTTTANNPGGTDYTPGNTNTDAPGSLDGSASVSGSATADLTSVTVTYNGSSFSPSSVTIQKGGTVNFVSASGNMWVASDVHPSHTDYDGTSRSVHCAAGYSGPAPFDQCAPGSSYAFTFTKSGTYTYHNHMNAGATGTVIVQ